jgi:hypothetical protein
MNFQPIIEHVALKYSYQGLNDETKLYLNTFLTNMYNEISYLNSMTDDTVEVKHLYADILKELKPDLAIIIGIAIDSVFNSISKQNIDLKTFLTTNETFKKYIPENTQLNDV